MRTKFVCLDNRLGVVISHQLYIMGLFISLRNPLSSLTGCTLPVFVSLYMCVLCRLRQCKVAPYAALLETQKSGIYLVQASGVQQPAPAMQLKRTSMHLQCNLY